VKWSEIQLEPRFYEIDSYNIVNNMFYLSWFEMGRFEIARQAGLICPQFQNENVMFAVVEAHVYYRKPIALFTTVIVESMIQKIAGSKIHFAHRIRNKKTNVLLAKGQTCVICLRDRKMLVKLPVWIEEKITGYIEDYQGGLL
jgi:acyl-CoA thioester hydrolase